MDSSTLTLRLDQKLKKELDKLAKATSRSRSFLAAEAIKEYVELNAWQTEQIREAVKAADRGEFATEQEVREAFGKWKKRAR